MSTAVFSIDEAVRLETLARLDILDIPPDDVLMGLARIAATVTGCPIAQVVLVDADRQWFKVSVGVDMVQTARDVSFCTHAIRGHGLFEVPDAAIDPRFANSPLVTGAPHARFYAGVPLDVDGQMVGTLCVIDRVPRRIDDAQRQTLLDLGNAVAQWMKSWSLQNALREAEAYRRSLFERLGDGVLLLDMEHRILDANPNAIELLGYDRDELLLLRGHDVVADFEWHRFDAPRTPADVRSRRMSEWEFVHKDGRPLPVEVNVRRLDETRYLAVVRDISRRRSQEHLLRQLSQAVEQSVESVIVFSLDHTIEYVNSAATRLFGYDRDELIGRRTDLVRSGETPQQTYDDLYTDLAAGRSWKGVLSCRRKDGTVYLQSTVMSPIRGHDGGVAHTIASMEDVTEKLRMTEELDRHRHRLEELVEARTAELAVAKQVAEAASTAKSDFLLTMSHEIRTPMNGVIGIVDVLRQSSLTPYQSDLTETIRESAFALLSVIDDLLDFSKIEAGRLSLQTESTCLFRLVESICDSLQPVASGRNVGLRVFVDPRLPDYVLTDPLRLRQILNNLVGNAIKFSGGQERRGRVRVSVEPDGPGWMCVKVGDNGIGMSSDVRSRIFRPFVQADSLTAQRFGGSGLGLSICRQLTTLFAGTIDVSSRPGEGSCFTVRLPVVADATRATSNAHALNGVVCHVVLTDDMRADEWCSYLRSAGATTKKWTNTTAFQNELFADRSKANVLLADDESYRALMPWIFPADDERPLSTVRVGRGQRCTPRLVQRGDVFLEGDALHRDELLHAVALATGRAAPYVVATTDIVPHATVPSVEEASKQGRLVLVAEDNEINQKVIKQQLALLGYAAQVVPDGIAALEAWRTGRYGLLLTDLRMPGLDGFGLASAIRSEEESGQHLPIVALTANALAGEGDRCIDAGMDAYLSKPVQLDLLAAAIDQRLPWRTDDRSSPRVVDDAMTEESRRSRVRLPLPSKLP